MVFERLQQARERLNTSFSDLIDLVAHLGSERSREVLEHYQAAWWSYHDELLACVDDIAAQAIEERQNAVGSDDEDSATARAPPS